MREWRSRIVGSAEVDPTELMANPLNWRIHPTHQRHAVKDALDEVGWVQQVIVNRTTGHLVDGHLRVDLAVEEGITSIPVEYVELSEEEERKVLATLDPLAGLAVTDSTNLALLTEGLDFSGSVLRGVVDDLLQAAEPPDHVPAQEPEPSSFWPRVSFQLPPNVYAEWRDLFEDLDGDEDHQKVEMLLDLARRGEGA